jgi:RHS repeat-associated protein
LRPNSVTAFQAPAWPTPLRTLIRFGGRVASVTYPSGRVVTNTRDSQLGKVASVSTTGFGNLVSGVTYRPFGGPKGLTNASGGVVNNQAGECDCLTSANLGEARERIYDYDWNRNLTSITGTSTPQYSQIFVYDELNRLTSATGRYGTIDYTYDDVGNRLTRNTNGVSESYTYYNGTNRLHQITGGLNPRTFSYDDDGNPTSDGTLTVIYDQENQLKEVKQGVNTIATYTYSGLGQRVKKVAGGITTVYHYDLDGKLIAESLPNGTMTREYLHMGKVRVALVDVAGGNALYHYLNDRLGTPEILTDASGTVAWEAWYEPFGEAHIHPSSSVVNNIRLPGQYYDSETGLHYNYHRYYDPRTGSYLTPDPIGQAGGLNLYPYVLNNPINAIDPLGLINVTKTAVGVANVYRGVVAGAEGVAALTVSIVAWGSGVGGPVGALGTVYAVYQLGVKLPGMLKHGTKQIAEGLRENPGEISFGSLQNLRGLGPLMSDVDDPCESYSAALEKKRQAAREIMNKALDKPFEAIGRAWDWLIDWAI